MDEKLLTLKEVEATVLEIASRLEGIQEDDFPTYGYSQDSAYPHIEVDATGYHWVVVERGEELERKTTLDMNDLLFIIFESMAFSISLRWASKNRRANEDFRRQLFLKQVELIHAVRPEFVDKLEVKIQKILKRNPFNDSET